MGVYTVGKILRLRFRWQGFQFRCPSRATGLGYHRPCCFWASWLGAEQPNPLPRRTPYASWALHRCRGVLQAVPALRRGGLGPAKAVDAKNCCFRDMNGFSYLDGESTLTANRIPCGITQISLGATAILPNSVLISKAPCWGT